MPVRTRLSMQPTLTASSPLSLAIGMMWHCGLPSKRRPRQLLSIQPQQDDRRLNGHIAQRSINYACRFFAHHRDLCHRFRRDPSGLAQRGDVGILRDLLDGLETMRQAADAAVAVVLRLSRKNPSCALDPEDAARRNSSRSAIRRSWRRGSLNSLDPGRNVADKGNCNGRNREAEELLQIEVPPLKATMRHGLSSRSDLPLVSSSTAQSPSPATELQSFVGFARSEAQEQYGSVKRGVRNTATRLLVEAVNQLPTDLPGLDGGFSAAQEQREQVVGARRLHVAVRLDRLQAEARCGDESGKPPHDVRCVHQITQHRACDCLQRIAIE